MGSGLHHGPAVHQNDHVRRLHRGQPVGNEEHGAPAEGLQEVEAHLPFGAGIEGTGGLIEDQHPRVLQHRPGQGQPLPLAAREACPPLAHVGVVALGQAHDEVVGTGNPSCPDQFGSAGIGLDQQQVVANGAVEQHGVLGHHTDLAAQGIQLNFVDIKPIDEHPPRISPVEAWQQLQQGALAATGATNQAHKRSRGHFKVDTIQDRLLIFAIAEHHVDKLNPTHHRWHRNILGFGLALLRWTVNHVGHHLQGGRGLLELLPGLHHLHQGSGDVATEDAEGDKATEGDLVAHHQVDANPNHDQAVEVLDKPGEIAEGLPGDLEFEVLADKPGVAVLEFPAGFELGVLGFNRLNPGDRFVEIGIGFHRLPHAAVDLAAHHRVADNRQDQH